MRKHLTITRDHLRHVVEAVPADQTERTPPIDGWTVAEVIGFHETRHAAQIEEITTSFV